MEIPNRKPVGDQVDPRDQGRNKRGYRMVADNGDFGLSKDSSRVEFLQSVIYQIGIVLGKRCDRAIDTLYADLQVCPRILNGPLQGGVIV